MQTFVCDACGRVFLLRREPSVPCPRCDQLAWSRKEKLTDERLERTASGSIRPPRRRRERPEREREPERGDR